MNLIELIVAILELFFAQATFRPLISVIFKLQQNLNYNSKFLFKIVFILYEKKKINEILFNDTMRIMKKLSI